MRLEMRERIVNYNDQKKNLLQFKKVCFCSFRIRIFNTAGPSFDLFDDLDELLLLSVRLALTQGIVEIKTFDENDKWNSAPDWTTFPFENEHTYKLTIVAQENHYQVETVSITMLFGVF